MAARLPLNPGATALLTGISSIVIAGSLTPSTVYAEEPAKKSIYDDYTSTPSSKPSTTSSVKSIISSVTGSSSKSDETEINRPTPTQRLAAQINYARNTLHGQVVRSQKTLDSLFDRYLSFEHNVTTTVADLAPSHRSGEQIIPGAIYVAISAMAGGVVSRNRFFPIRVITPLITGVMASWYFLPETSRNVGDLAWKWETKVPQIAETHLAIRHGIEDGINVTSGTYHQARGLIHDSTISARQTIEGWVRSSK